MGSEVRKGVACESTAINLNVDTLALETSAGPLIVSSLNILQRWYPKISMILSVCVLSRSVMSDSYNPIYKGLHLYSTLKGTKKSFHGGQMGPIQGL